MSHFMLSYLIKRISILFDRIIFILNHDTLHFSIVTLQQLETRTFSSSTREKSKCVKLGSIAKEISHTIVFFGSGWCARPAGLRRYSLHPIHPKPQI